jgi:hypothetical protein
MKQQTDTPTPGDAPSSAFASAEEMPSPPELQGHRRKGHGKRATDKEEDASTDEEIMPGAVP